MVNAPVPPKPAAAIRGGENQKQNGYSTTIVTALITLTQLESLLPSATCRGVWPLYTWTTEAPWSRSNRVASGRSSAHAWYKGLPPYCKHAREGARPSQFREWVGRGEYGGGQFRSSYNNML